MLTNHLIFEHYLPFLKRQLNEIYFLHGMRSFMTALAGIFIPIYLLTLNFSLKEIFLFFIIQYISVVIAYFIVTYISTKIGLKHILLIWVPVNLSYLLMFYFLDKLNIDIYAIALLGGFQLAFYWVPLQCLFGRASEKDHLGKNCSNLEIFKKIGTTFAPLLGGIIIFFLGFHTLFLILIIISLFSIVPIFQTPEIKPHVTFEIKKISKILKKHPKMFFFFFLDQFNFITESIIWPIFVFLILKNTISIGFVGTLLSLGSVIFIFFIGRSSDKSNKKTMIKIGALLTTLIWFSRYYLNSEIYIYVLTILIGIFSIMKVIPLNALFYQSVKKSDTEEYIISKEIVITVSRILALLIAMFLMDKLDFNFITTGIANLLILFS